jgi:hypothetical protein
MIFSVISQTPPFFLVSSDFLHGWFSGEPASGPCVSASAAAAAASLSTAPGDAQHQQDMESAKNKSLATMSLQQSVSATSVGFDIGSAISIKDDDKIDEHGESTVASDAVIDAPAQPPVLSASALVAFPYPSLDFDFNKSLLCHHGRANPLKMHAMKRVSLACWEAIRRDGYLAATELSHRSLCSECVYAQIDSASRVDAQKQQLIDLASELDATKDVATGFVVSKKFIQAWKAEVKKVKTDFTKLTVQINQDILCDCSAALVGRDSVSLPAFSAKLKPFDFKANARFVSADLWARLRRSDERFSNSVSVQSLDPDAVAPFAAAPAQDPAKKRKTSGPSFSSSSSSLSSSSWSSSSAKKSGVDMDAIDSVFCVKCRAKDDEDAEARCSVNNVRDYQRKHVAMPSSTFADEFPPAEIKMGTYCIIPQSWFQRWSSFIQHGSGRQPKEPSDFDDKLLCEQHNKLCYAPWPINSQVSYRGDEAPGAMLHCDAGEIRLLQVKEFERLQALYPALGDPINVEFSRKERSTRGSGSLPVVAWCGVDVITSPEICVGCAAKRMEEKLERNLHFECGTITLVPGSIRSTEVTSASSSSSSSSSAAAPAAPAGRSRSSRTKKGSSNVEDIASSMTIDALKLNMMGLDIGASVEHVNHIVLHYNGVILETGSKSLLDYRIPSGAKVEYAIDTRIYSPDCEDFFGSDARAPERGFADSNFFKS